MNEIIKQPAKKLIENSELLTKQIAIDIQPMKTASKEQVEIALQKIMTQYDNTLKRLAQ